MLIVLGSLVIGGAIGSWLRLEEPPGGVRRLVAGPAVARGRA